MEQMAVISWGIPLAVIIVAMSIDRILNVEEIPIDVILCIVFLFLRSAYVASCL